MASSLRVGDTVLSTWRECANFLLGEFFPRAEVQVPPAQEVPVPPLDVGELDYAFGLVRSKRSSGFDGLNGEMCKCLWKFIPEYLEAIYDNCICEGYFPREWKAARVAYRAAKWYESASTAIGRRYLMACQRFMLLACMPVCHTVSTDALQVLLGAPPLDLLVIQRAVTFRLRRRLCMPLLRDSWLSDSDIGRGYLECKRLLNACLVRKWQNRWDNSSKGRVTYEYIRDISFVGENADFGFSLSLGFLLTGHGPLNAFLHERHLSTSEECACGSAREDWKHVLCECPMYSGIRDLVGAGICWTDGRYDMSGVIANRRNVEMLGQYAREVFRRRRNFRRSVD